MPNCCLFSELSLITSSEKTVPLKKLFYVYRFQKMRQRELPPLPQVRPLLLFLLLLRNWHLSVCLSDPKYNQGTPVIKHPISYVTWFHSCLQVYITCSFIGNNHQLVVEVQVLPVLHWFSLL